MNKTNEERKKAKEDLIKKINTAELKIGEVVKIIRIIYNMNQEDYAKMVGLTRKTIYQIENETEKASMKSVSKALAPMHLKLGVTRD